MPWTGDYHFEVVTADGPWKIKHLPQVQWDAGYGARMTAGYCWQSSDPIKDDKLIDDVRVGDWSPPWNLKGERAVGGAPPASLWAIDPGGCGQVGCVYTAQGLEYDWNGLLLGPDLVWCEGRRVTRRELNKDPDFPNRSRVDDLEFDRLVRNVYKMLLTRGMVGTVLASVDAEMQQTLSHLVPVRALTSPGLSRSR